MKLYEHFYASKYSENIIIHKDEVDASWQNKNTSMLL